MSIAERIRFYKLAIPCFIYFLVFYILPPPLPIHADKHLLDPSWHLILTQAFLNGTHFGRDLIYTYGPWGFVENPRGDPRIYPWLVGARLLVTLAFIGGAALILVRTVKTRVVQAAALGWIAVVSNPLSVLPMLLFGVAFLEDRKRDSRPSVIIHLLAIACALDMWIKFTSFVLVAALVAVLATQDLLRRQRPVIAAEICAAAVAFWLLARQPLTGVADFLHGALSTAASYSGAMFLPGPYKEAWLVGVLLTALAIPALLSIRRGVTWAMLPAIGWIALLFFLQLKEAFVRYDDQHVWMGIIDALQPCALIALCLIGFLEAPMPRALRRVCAACVVTTGVVLTGMMVRSNTGLDRMLTTMENLSRLKSFVLGRSLADAYREQLADFARKAPLARVPGTAEFFPDDQILLFGNSLPVSLPPVPQSFAAYNEYLSGRNAAFFRSPARPEYVFFDVDPIDKRYPTAADNLSWLALSDCYRPAGYSDTFLLLRAAECQPSSLEPLAETTVRFGQKVSVPEGDEPVWAVIDIRLTPMGAVFAALARPPAAAMAIDTAEGRQEYSLSLESARMGLLLSPVMRDAESFGNLLSRAEVDQTTAVRKMTITQTEGSALFEPTVFVRLYRIHRGRPLSARR